jgi:hypothetical protein
MQPAVDKLLLLAAREVKLLGATAPLGAAAERTRLVEALRAGRAERPRWAYEPVAHDELRAALDAAERILAAQPSTPLGQLYLERIRELALEAELCASAGTARVATLGQADASLRAEASRTCDAWLAEPAAPWTPALASDDPDPRSLLSRLRAEVGRQRLPFAVVAQPSLAPLAATGDRVILVACGRPTSEEDVERTVLHEIEGHARPRARAAQVAHVLLRAGTARGNDDQEGRALLLEERASLLGPRRRRMLAARHRAVEAMCSGATFPDVTTLLTRDHGVTPEDAVVCAERAFRGGDGIHPGLGRERVYLEALIRVRRHLEAQPLDERVLEAGQVSIEAVSVLSALV